MKHEGLSAAGLRARARGRGGATAETVALLVPFRQSREPDVGSRRQVRGGQSRHQDRGRERALEQLLRQALHRARRRQRARCGDGQAVRAAAPDRDGRARADRRAASTPGPARPTCSTTCSTSTRGPDGKQYYLPIQYVVLYLYYRADLFEAAGLKPPKTCEEFRAAAKALTPMATADDLRLRLPRRQGRAGTSGALRARRQGAELDAGRADHAAGGRRQPVGGRPVPEGQGRSRPRRRTTASRKSSAPSSPARRR